MTDEDHLLLGAYLLGGLAPSERRHFEEHLLDCARCRTELGDTAPIPALLRTADRATLVEPSPAAPTALVEAAAAQARRRRRIQQFLGAAAAACLVGAATTVGVVATREPAVPTVTVAAAGGSHITGTVGLVAKPWGTALTLTVSGLTGSGSFTLRAVDRTGTTQQAATWSAVPDGAVTVVGATGIATAELRAVEIIGEDGRTVATARV